MNNHQFLCIKSLSYKSMKGVSTYKQVVRVAAMHNLRELATEFGTAADGRIDATRISQNYILRGLNTSEGVATMAHALMNNAGVTNPRKDTIMAIEVLIGLPSYSEINHHDFFNDSVAWADSYFQAPILSAVVHLDEQVKHCHILILPLVAGRMNGGKLAGDKRKIKAMQIDFNAQVGKKFGLSHQPRQKRLGAEAKHNACKQILAEIKSKPQSLDQPNVRDALFNAIGQNVEPIIRALGLKLTGPKKVRAQTFVEIMTKPVKPERIKWMPGGSNP